MWKALTAGLVLGGTAAMAQTSADPGSNRGPNNDPNQVVCRSEAEIGSRVSRRRVCRTRAEWQELQVEQRKTTERVQFMKVTCERPPCG